jgi:hypothetical protein
MTLESPHEKGSVMNVLIVLFSWLGLFAGQALPPSSIGTGSSDCPTNGCGQNGTRMTGLVIDVPGEVAAITLSSGEVVVTGGVVCAGCGLNGTQVTGLVVDLPDHLDAVTLPSGERVALR